MELLPAHRCISTNLKLWNDLEKRQHDVPPLSSSPNGYHMQVVDTMLPTLSKCRHDSSQMETTPSQ